MTSSNHKAAHRALIIGGSMAGLFTALLLHKRGWRVDVFERSTDELASRGAGIATHPEMMVALDKAGVGSAGLGVELGRVHVVPRQGKENDNRDRIQAAARSRGIVRPRGSLLAMRRRWRLVAVTGAFVEHLEHHDSAR